MMKVAVIACLLAVACAAPQNYNSNQDGLIPGTKFGPTGQPYIPNPLLASAAEGMLNDFNKDSIPVLFKATDQSLASLMSLTEDAGPLLAELSEATAKEVREYTAALRKYNAEGGSYPQPPKRLDLFRQFRDLVRDAQKNY